MPRQEGQPFVFATAPQPFAASVSEEFVRRAYVNSGAPATWWITEVQLDPPQLIVADQATGKAYRVPVSIFGSQIRFGDPVEFTPAQARPAASVRASAAAGGNDMTDSPSRRALAAHDTILRAARRGAITPETALKYAHRAARGEDVSHLDICDGITAAAAPSDLGGQILSILMGIADALGITPDDDTGDEFSGLFPSNAPLGPQDASTGPAHFAPPSRQKFYNKPMRPVRHASAASDDLTAAEADDLAVLYPPRTPADVDNRHRAVDRRDRRVAAQRELDDYSDDEIYGSLFIDGEEG